MKNSLPSQYPQRCRELIHASVANEMTQYALWPEIPRQRIMANVMRPMHPRDATAASTLAAMRPRMVPSNPYSALRFFSGPRSSSPCGKIAGNERNRPPIAGPKSLCYESRQNYTCSTKENPYDVFMRPGRSKRRQIRFEPVSPASQSGTTT
jgi:hypothetical protein